MTKTKELILNEYPEGIPTESNFKIQDVEVPDLKDGDILLQTIYISVDPYQRGRMKIMDKPYFPPFKPGQPMDNSIVAKVKESKNEDFSVGDYVTAFLPYRELNVVEKDQIPKASVKNVTEHVKNGAKPIKFLSAIGMVGLTAYFGLLDLGKPEKGNTVLVSGAAGAVGSIVGQIAKIKGCRVVGIAGSESKINWITKDLGFDAGINYKTTDNLSKSIQEKCPDGVDVYFDNVGAHVLEAAIDNMNEFGRIVACGAISTYNDKEPTPGPRNLFLIVVRQLRMEGFLLKRYFDRAEEGMSALLQWVGEGKIKTEETVFEGFDKIPDAFIGLFTGKNTGKMVIKVADE